jgi:putative FmdB family regulatory protein
MPTYEYQCNACNHRFEELQSFSEAPLRKCPKCKKNRLQRLLGAGAAIIFKGAGFYQTDYRSDSYKSAAKADEARQTTEKNGTDAPKAPADTNATSGSETKKDAPAGKKNAKS